VSSAEAQRFAQITTQFTDTVKGLGKFDPAAFSMALEAARMTFQNEMLRWMVGKEVKITKDGDVYGRQWDLEQYESILDSVLEREYYKNLIYLAIKAGFTSVRGINQQTGLDLVLISRLIADMEKTNKVEFTGMEDRVPVFAAL
jgi:hypothetical protein